jgi:hypothetical protein
MIQYYLSKEKSLVCHKSSFMTVVYYADLSLISVDWTQESGMMTDEEFRGETLKYVAFDVKYSPKSVIHQMINFGYVMSPDMQVWTDENINKPAFAAGVRNVIFVMSEDFFTQVSVAQTMEEKEGQKFFNSFVRTEKEALSVVYEYNLKNQAVEI